MTMRTDREVVFAAYKRISKKYRKNREVLPNIAIHGERLCIEYGCMCRICIEAKDSSV